MTTDKKISVNEEVVLFCAFRYALGRKTGVVSSVCAELKKNYHSFSTNSRNMIAQEIQDYQDKYGNVGMDFDNIEWNLVKWLFDTSRVTKIRIKSNHNIWRECDAIKGEDGVYYSIPHMQSYNYHNIIEL